jgi:hypothetical protein
VLHNEELHNLHTSPNIIVTKLRRKPRAEHVEHMEHMRSVYNFFCRKHEAKRPHWRIWHTYNNNNNNNNNNTVP